MSTNVERLVRLDADGAGAPVATTAKAVDEGPLPGMVAGAAATKKLRETRQAAHSGQTLWA